MDFTIRNQDGLVCLALKGRLDSTAANEITPHIQQELASYKPDCPLICDTRELEYISSAGLRVLLMLAKKFKNFRVTEAQPDVFNVLEMTGFTKMMTVERALREISLKGCEEIGRGGVGIVYRIDDETIIKVFREGTNIDEVKTEITMAKEAFVLGMPTAISFDIVRAGDKYGLVYELLKAETLSTIISREPEKIDEFARLYAGMFRQLHSIEVPKGSTIPDAIEKAERSIRKINRYFDDESVDLLLQIISYVPKSNRLLHCDLQTKNIMMQGSEPMLIDMGEVSCGHPLIDLAYAYSAMVSFVGDYEQTIGIPRAVGLDLWQRAMNYYFEGTDEAEVRHRMEQIETVSRVRNFSWLSLSDSFPEAVVRECQEIFVQRVANQKERILEICKTFSDWTL
ncbi:MAG: phosphotransferase [Prevotella sp.]|nr:phosphotransferase [Prevotella sp.]